VTDAQVKAFTADDFAAVSRATAQQVADLAQFRVLLEDWSARMNLVGPSAMATFWERHAWDSAQLFHVEHTASTWADIGAGAGFPGVVLAILLKGRPGARVHLIESMAKRVRFLDAVVQALDLPADIHHARAEDLEGIAGLQMVTARACAPFPRLFDYTHHFFEAGAKGLFLKGRDAEAELTEAARSWTFQAELIPSRSDPSGRLVRIERLASRARAF
jgi:16S rRNA (guanine527-N7)-methyltransferase